MINKLILNLNRCVPAIYLGPFICWFLFYSILQPTLFYPLILFFFLFNILSLFIFETKLSLSFKLFILCSFGLFFSIILGFKDLGLILCFSLVFLIDLLFHVYLSVTKKYSTSFWLVFLCSLTLLSTFYPVTIQQLIQTLAFLLIVSFIIAQAHGQLNKENNVSVPLIFLSSGQKLSYLFLIVQSCLFIFHDSIMKGLTICSSFVLTLISWIAQFIFSLFGFIFTLLITLIQNVIRFFLLQPSSTPSKPIPSASADAYSQLQDKVQQLNPLFQIALLMGCVLFVLIFIVLIFRFLIKLFKKSTRTTPSSQFEKETSTGEIVKPSSLQDRFVKWIHPENVSPLRKKYRQSVNLKIKEGINHLPQDTPSEYLKKVNEANQDDDFTDLTDEYLKQRYKF